MIIKVHNPKLAVGGNKGSVSNLVEYLDKENRDVDELNQVHFFNKDGSHFSAAVVEREIDNNKGKLSKDETKFYMITVNPSQSELKHIGHDEEKFKSYINDLMDKYADNFNRTYEGGKPLTGNDIMYYSKIEHDRTYKFNERGFEQEMKFNSQIQKDIFQLEKKLRQVEKNNNISEVNDIKYKIKEAEKKYIRNSEGTIIKEGNLKDGNNLHAHIIISRYDKTQTMKLSPMSNHKQSKNIVNGKEVSIGFNRDQFVSNGEKLFDQKFAYKREYNKSYNYYKETKQIRSLSNILHLTDPKSFAKMAAKRAMIEMINDKTLQKQLGYMSDPRKLPKKALRELEKKAIESVMKGLGAAAYTNPVTAGVQVAKQAITLATKTMSKGMGI